MTEIGAHHLQKDMCPIRPHIRLKRRRQRIHLRHIPAVPYALGDVRPVLEVLHGFQQVHRAGVYLLLMQHAVHRVVHEPRIRALLIKPDRRPRHRRGCGSTSGTGGRGLARCRRGRPCPCPCPRSRSRKCRTAHARLSLYRWQVYEPHLRLAALRSRLPFPRAREAPEAFLVLLRCGRGARFCALRRGMRLWLLLVLHGCQERSSLREVEEVSVRRSLVQISRWRGEGVADGAPGSRRRRRAKYAGVWGRQRLENAGDIVLRGVRVLLSFRPTILVAVGVLCLPLGLVPWLLLSLVRWLLRVRVLVLGSRVVRRIGMHGKRLVVRRLCATACAGPDMGGCKVHERSRSCKRCEEGRRGHALRLRWGLGLGLGLGLRLVLGLRGRLWLRLRLRVVPGLWHRWIKPMVRIGAT